MQGDLSLSRAFVGLKTLLTFCGDKNKLFWIEWYQVKVSIAEPELRDPSKGKHVHKEFIIVFDMLSLLPQFRGADHSIVLQEGTNSISVRPYQYPQYQKEEINRPVGEILR